MNATQSEYFRMAVPAALYCQKTYGVPASIQLAQGALESGWGQSGLAKQCNNFFGVKAAHDAKPDTYRAFETTEYEHGQLVHVEADFAKYASVTLGFAAHARLLALAPRYKPAMAVRGDAAAFARELQECGYSTNRPPLASHPPYYADALMELVREFDLTQYDAPPQPPAAAQEAA
jgi:flagellum-specific peptidoglycan hydrolase FlgJ